MNDHILMAYLLSKSKSKGQLLTEQEVDNQIKGTDSLTWIHMDANHTGTRIWLEQQSNYLDPFIIEALLEDETRPRIVQVGNGALISLRGVNLNKNSDPEDMVSIRLWVDEHRIISLRRRRLKAVLDIEERIKDGKGPCDTGEFVCMLISRLFERMEPVLSDLDDLTDHIEEQVLESANSMLRENIVDVRKKAILFRRYMAPQRDAIGQLRAAELNWMNDAHKRQLHESYNHVTRYVEDLDAIRERAQIVKDEIANILSDRLNKNMYVLSVIAAIFLPLGFLTGLLGINVGGIPGAENVSAFFIFCCILVVIVTFQIIIFKKLKWF